MKEIMEYIDKLEARNKTYLKMFDKLLDQIDELSEKIEKLEARLYSLELNDPSFFEN